MLRAPIWITSASSATASACCGVEQLGDDRQAGLARAPRRGSRAPRAPRPLNANGDVRGLNAPPRSIEAPAAATVRATPSVCSRDSTVHGPAISANVSPPPTVRPSTANDGRLVVGELGRGELVRAARSGRRGRRPACPRAPARARPRVADRADRRRQLARQHEHVHADRLEPARTAATSASAASGVITIITGRAPARRARRRRDGAPARGARCAGPARAARPGRARSRAAACRGR